jgi:plastocyanin
VWLAACGTSGGGGGKMDAPGSGGGNTVMTVSCTGVTPVATVTTPNDGLAYSSSPAGTSSTNSAIHVNDVVSFMPGANHPVGPDTSAGMTDNGLVAPAQATTCLKFTAVGTFHYKCTVHGFTGTVTVQ